MLHLTAEDVVGVVVAEEAIVEADQPDLLGQ